MSEAHERWEALIERELLGEALDADERAFVRAHEAAHPELAFERELWDAALGRLARPEESPEQLEQLAARALAAHRGRAAGTSEAGPSEAGPSEAGPSEAGPSEAAFKEVSQERRRRTRRVALASAAALVLVSAAALGLGLSLAGERGEPRVADTAALDGPPRPPDGPPRSPDELPSTTPRDRELVVPAAEAGYISMATTEGSLGRALAPGAGLSGAGCISWARPGAVVCFEGRIELEPDSEPGQRSLRLHEGRLVAALAPLPPGQRFEVETSRGSVRALGTVFAVEVGEGPAPVWVSVLEGRVELRGGQLRGDGPRTLGVGQRAHFGGGEVDTETVSPELEPLAELARLLRASSGRAELILDLPDEASLEIDGRRVGPEVHALLLAPARHRLVLFDGAGEFVAGAHLHPSESRPTALARVLPQAFARLTEAAPAEPEARRDTPSARQLARAAQREREAGHHAETARLYRALLEHHPDSPEAVNVPVRLGDLLASTGDHEGALAAYELYLEGGAAQLAPEAEYGRILALRALGREAEEAEAVAAFAAAYPDDYRTIEFIGELTGSSD